MAALRCCTRRGQAGRRLDCRVASGGHARAARMAARDTLAAGAGRARHRGGAVGCRRGAPPAPSLAASLLLGYAAAMAWHRPTAAGSTAAAAARRCRCRGRWSRATQCWPRSRCWLLHVASERRAGPARRSRPSAARCSAPRCSTPLSTRCCAISMRAAPEPSSMEFAMSVLDCFGGRCCGPRSSPWLCWCGRCRARSACCSSASRRWARWSPMPARGRRPRRRASSAHAGGRASGGDRRRAGEAARWCSSSRRPARCARS